MFLVTPAFRCPCLDFFLLALGVWLLRTALRWDAHDL